jgi:hypothetical protein
VAPAVLSSAGSALAGALVLDADDGEPRELDDGAVGREAAAGLGDLAEPVLGLSFAIAPADTDAEQQLSAS